MDVASEPCQGEEQHKHDGVKASAAVKGAAGSRAGGATILCPGHTDHSHFLQGCPPELLQYTGDEQRDVLTSAGETAHSSRDCSQESIGYKGSGCTRGEAV